MGRIGAHIRDADLAHIEQEGKTLAFERERSEPGRSERECKPEHGREELEKIQEIELVKYKSANVSSRALTRTWSSLLVRLGSASLRAGGRGAT